MNSLIGKIAKASTSVGSLSADKTNTAQNYSYISADKILDRAGGALAEVGVVLVPSIVHETTNETTYTNEYGKSKTRYDAVVSFEMLVSDGESEIKTLWVGRGSDFSVPDKAMYKAITSGHKYYLAKLLNVGVGNEDGEHEAESTQEAVQDATKSTKPAQGAQKAQNTPQTQHKGSDAKQSEKAAERAPDAAQADNPFEGPDDAELEVLGTWVTPNDAQTWAVEIGACKNVHEARESFKKVVDENGGRLKNENVAAIYLQYLRKQNGKVAV